MKIESIQLHISGNDDRAFDVEVSYTGYISVSTKGVFGSSHQVATGHWDHDGGVVIEPEFKSVSEATALNISLTVADLLDSTGFTTDEGVCGDRFIRKENCPFPTCSHARARAGAAT